MLTWKVSSYCCLYLHSPSVRAMCPCLLCKDMTWLEHRYQITQKKHWLISHVWLKEVSRLVATLFYWLFRRLLCITHLSQQVTLPTSTQCDTLLYRAYSPTILHSQIPWMSRVARLANERALDHALTADWEHSLLVSVGMLDQIGR